MRYHTPWTDFQSSTTPRQRGRRNQMVSTFVFGKLSTPPFWAPYRHSPGMRGQSIPPSRETPDRRRQVRLPSPYLRAVFFPPLPLEIANYFPPPKATQYFRFSHEQGRLGFETANVSVANLKRDFSLDYEATAHVRRSTQCIDGTPR